MTTSPSETDTRTPQELLPVFYKQYGLDNDGGQSSRYVKIELTKKINLYFPNFDARRKAVLKHDIHHIATGYTSTFKGETEIGAWEIASGCRHYWVAFVLDMHAMMIGILFNPVGVYKAFLKGRKTYNLYRDTYSDDQLVRMPISKIKESLLLNNYSDRTKAGMTDILLFSVTILFGIVYSILSLLLLPFIVVYTVFILAKKK